MKDDKLPIYVSVTVNGRRSEISLKHFIAKDYWNSQKGQGKGNNPEIIQLNQYLLQVRSRLVESYRELQLQDKSLTAEMVKNKFLGVSEDRPTLLNLIDYHNESMQGVLAPGTFKNYYTTKKY